MQTQEKEENTMKNVLIKMTVFLLALLLLAGCSSGSPRETKSDPAKKTQASSKTEKPTDSSKEETKKQADSGMNETEPAETADTESKENPTEETKEETPADLYRKAVRISEDTHYGEEGTYGIFDHYLLEDTSSPYLSHMAKRDDIFLYFGDRAYYLQIERDSGTVENVALHSEGHFWTTAYGTETAYYPAKRIREDTSTTVLASSYAFSSLSSYYYQYNDQINKAPEETVYNRDLCWCFTMVNDAVSSRYPEGSVSRTRILFRQEDLIFVYARRDIVAPDGTEFPIVERRILSGKEVEEIYQTHAQDFSDIERRDSSGDWILTIVIAPGEKDEQTLRVPICAGEQPENSFFDQTYMWYWDRERTKRVDIYNIEITADTTIYVFKK